MITIAVIAFIIDGQNFGLLVVSAKILAKKKLERKWILVKGVLFAIEKLAKLV